MFSNKYKSLAQVPYGEKERDVMSFLRYPLGENTSLPAFQLDAKELAYCIDFKINPGGRLQSRPAFNDYLEDMVDSVESIVSAIINGEIYTLFSAGDYIYYLDGSMEAVSIDEVDGPAKLLPFNNTCLVLDGGYLKYIKSLTEIHLAHDDGDDDSAQVNNIHGEQDSSTAVATGAITRVAAKFTTPNYGTGWTLPVTRIAAIVEDNGTPEITFKVRKVSDDSIVAEKAYVGPVAASPGEIEIYLTDSDITAELISSTDYYVCVEGTDFKIYHTDISSGGTAYTYNASWSADTTKIPCISLWPGLPPKASFGLIHANSPFIVDPDEPGKIKFGNQTHLDWSTTGEAGYLGVGDDSTNSFPVGALANFYNEVIIFGTKAWPYTMRLTGTDPSNFAIQDLFQGIWTNPKLVQNTNNELWFSSEIGATTLSGIDEFGDLRTHPASDAIENVFREHWSEGAVSGYFPDAGQYWLFFPDNPEYIHICHVKQPIKDADGKIRYPWTRYSIPEITDVGKGLDDTYAFTPTCFAYIQSHFLIGTDEGFIVTLDESVIKDFELAYIEPKFKTAYMESMFNNVDLEKIQTLIACRTGFNLTLNVYINGRRRVVYTDFARSGAMADDVTIAEVADIVIEDVMSVPIEENRSPSFFLSNINCYSMQFECLDFKVFGLPIYVDGFIVKVRKLEE